MPIHRPRRIFLDPVDGEEEILDRARRLARDRGVPLFPLAGTGAQPGRGDLVLRPLKGAWIRPFRTGACAPGDRAFFLAGAQGCPFACGYCYLQGTLEGEAAVLATNPVALEPEIASLPNFAGTGSVRVHAAHLGELLAWEAWTGLARRIAETFAPRPDLLLELRTKIDDLGPLLDEALPRNTILSWTLTPDTMASRFERGLPPPARRIEAARRAAGDGFAVGLRLDPVLLVPGWEDAYAALIREAGRALAGSKVESVEIGVFRCTKEVAAHIRRGPFRRLLAGEFLPGHDGKMRHFWPHRVEAYRLLGGWIRDAFGPSVRLDLCMEPDWIRDRIPGIAS